MPGIFDTVVDPEVQRLLRRESQLLVRLRDTLEREQVEERVRVDQLLAGLDDLFTIVIVGEFNAGKSSLINALFGQSLRREGPIPVDDHISLLRHGDQATERRVSDFVVEQFYPVDFLRNITLVDTPGTNSIVQRHQEITEDYIPRADLVLFVTSIDRPLSESERKFLEYIHDWGKKLIFVLNKIDTKTPEEVAQVLDYVKSNTRAIFGFDPVIFPVSGKLGLESKLGVLPRHEWTRSNFEGLENYIFKVLSEKERVRIKLQAPLDTISSLAKKQFAMIDSRRKVLAADRDRLGAITAQLSLANEDLAANFQQFISRIDNLMLELQRRGVDFLDRFVRIGHFFVLRDPLRFREEFDRQVFMNWHGSIDSTVQESVDWLVKENMKLWNGTVEAFRRQVEVDVRDPVMVGEVGREFAYNRESVYSRIRTETERRLSAYDLGIESRRIIDGAMRGVFHSVGLGVAAVGFGYLFTTAVSSMALDVTGLTAATMLLVTSFLILPYKRSKARNEFRDRIEELRSQIRASLMGESATEIGRMIRGITGAFEPYERFYKSESQKVERFSGNLSEIEKESHTIGTAVAAL